MKTNRRTFIQGLGTGVVGAWASGSVAAAAPAAAVAASWPIFEAAQPAAFWRAVRASYPLLEDPLYLNTGGLGPVAQPVLDQMIATMYKLQQHSETGYDLFEPARVTVAQFIGAQSREISFVRNATEGNCLIAAGLALTAGDEVIFESHAHPGGSFPWYNQAKLRGITVRLFEPDPTSPEANLARIRALITPRTKVIQVSHITCTTGLVMPVAAIARLAQLQGIWFHVDGAQAVGMIPVNLNALGCDSYAFSGHKWLGGPHETGVFYIRRDRLAEVAPTSMGSHGAELPFLPGELKYFDGTRRHEYGTRNAGLITGLAEAVRGQTLMGPERIAAHGRELATLLQTELARIAGITVLTPRADDMRAAMTSIRHTRAGAHKLFTYLLDEHRLRCRPVTEQGLEVVRISTHIFNSPADCERVINGVRAAARAL